MYVDPEKVQCRDKAHGNKVDARDLMTCPELFSMATPQDGTELKEILRHLTVYAPWKGRPFIRKWIYALLPCFVRWILASDNMDNGTAISTLKHLGAAFGQPGILVCLPDKGAAILKTFQTAARSVEALGRGTVERYYWKRLAESYCGGEAEWQQLVAIPDKSLSLSHLDSLPKGWLLDANDWVHFFANIVSPEISERLEKMVCNTVKTAGVAVHPGPPKTYSRSLAKTQEYYSEYCKDPEAERWANFRDQFEMCFGREPCKAEDFVWNIVDFARCTIVVPSATKLLCVKRLLERRFAVVCVKNGYNSEKIVKGSGYRDMKLLVQVDFDKLTLGNIPVLETKKTTLICEIQLLCET